MKIQWVHSEKWETTIENHGNKTEVFIVKYGEYYLPYVKNRWIEYKETSFEESLMRIKQYLGIPLNNNDSQSFQCIKIKK
jgi:hypothetical protein